MEKGSKNQLDGTVAPGKRFNGIVGYEVPVDWKELEVVVTPDFWAEKISPLSRSMVRTTDSTELQNPVEPSFILIAWLIHRQNTLGTGLPDSLWKNFEKYEKRY